MNHNPNKENLNRIYGINPVSELLKNNPQKLRKILIPQGKISERIKTIIEKAEKSNVRIEFIEFGEFRNIEHADDAQKIMAEIKMFEYSSLDQLILGARHALSLPVIIAADCITDPHNLGAIIRSVWFFGGAGIVILHDRSAHINDTVIKASAGSALLLPVAKVVNLVRTLNELKEKGFWIIGSDLEGEGKSIDELNITEPHVLVVGSEGRGIRRLVRETCDFIVKIPSPTNFDSLNVSIFTGIYLYNLKLKIREY